jgi:hypothetical protein
VAKWIPALGRGSLRVPQSELAQFNHPMPHIPVFGDVSMRTVTDAGDELVERGTAGEGWIKILAVGAGFACANAVEQFGFGWTNVFHTLDCSR